MIRLWSPPDESRYLCSFGITETIAAVITSVAVDAGVGAATAATIGTIGSGVVLGAGVGAVGAAVTGGNVGLGALTGGITGGLIPAGGIIGGDIGGTTGAAIGDVIGGAAGGALGAGITGGNPLTSALEGGAAGGIAAALAPSTTGEPLPGGAGTSAGGPAGGAISPTAQEALGSQTASLVSGGAPSGAAPSTALGTLSQAPSTMAGPTPNGGGQIFSPPDVAAQVAAMPLVPDSNVSGGFSETPTPTTGGGPALQQGTPFAGEIPTGANVSPGATQALSSAGSPAERFLAAPTTGNAATDLVSGGAGGPSIARAGEVAGGTSSGGGGLGSFLSKPSTLLAAAPLAMTLLRGESSLPPQFNQLQGSVTGPLVATEREQLALANKGQLTPGAASTVSQYVQEATTALYQTLANEGVSNPAGDTRYIQGLGAIQQQAGVITQQFITQEFNAAFTAAGDASSNLIAAANAQIANDNAFSEALSAAMTSAGLIFAMSGGLKAA